MNYGQAKERTLKLLDEYGTGEGQVLDEHILARLPTAIDMAHKELSKACRSVAEVCVAELEADAERANVRVPPCDLVSVRRAWYRGKAVKPPKLLGGLLHIDKSLAPLELYLEYVRFPFTVDSTTPDDTELLLPLDVCEALPFLSAMIIAAGESGVDVAAIRELYNMIMAGVNTAESNSILVVKNGLGD